jgi:hypothetical protein
VVLVDMCGTEVVAALGERSSARLRSSRQKLFSEISVEPFVRFFVDL